CDATTSAAGHLLQELLQLGCQVRGPLPERKIPAGCEAFAIDQLEVRAAYVQAQVARHRATSCFPFTVDATGRCGTHCGSIGCVCVSSPPSRSRTVVPSSRNDRDRPSNTIGPSAFV